MNTKTEYHHFRALERAPEKREDFLAETWRSNTGQQGKPKGTAMQRIPQALRAMIKTLHLILFTLCLFLVTGSALHAKGKGSGNGGGGSGGGTPPGVVYIGNRGDYYSMNSDGSALTFLFNESVVTVEPSHQLHVGQRWFLQFRAILNETYPDGVQRFELFARSQLGMLVQLTDDPDLQLADSMHMGPGSAVSVSDLGQTSPRWASDDGAVAYLARRWQTDPNTGVSSVEEVGIYEIDFVGDVASVLAPAAPVRLNVNIPVLMDQGGGMQEMEPEVSGFDWSPDQSMIVYSTQQSGLFVADPLTGLQVMMFPGGSHQPRWSPDDSQIVFIDGSFVYLLDVTSGTVTPILDRGEADAKSTKNGAIITAADWSPSNENLIFTRLIINFRAWPPLKSKSDVCRSTSTGSEETCLNLSLDHDYSLGWRE
jgi:hypothetical protein